MERVGSVFDFLIFFKKNTVFSTAGIPPRRAAKLSHPKLSAHILASEQQAIFCFRFTHVGISTSYFLYTKPSIISTFAPPQIQRSPTEATPTEMKPPLTLHSTCQPRGTGLGLGLGLRVTTNLGVLVVQVVLLSGVVLQVVQLVAVGVGVVVELAQVQAVLALAGAGAGHVRVEEFIALQKRKKKGPTKKRGAMKRWICTIGRF